MSYAKIEYELGVIENERNSYKEPEPMVKYIYDFYGTGLSIAHYPDPKTGMVKVALAFLSPSDEHNRKHAREVLDKRINTYGSPYTFYYCDVNPKKRWTTSRLMNAVRAYYQESAGLNQHQNYILRTTAAIIGYDYPSNEFVMLYYDTGIDFTNESDEPVIQPIQPIQPIHAEFENPLKDTYGLRVEIDGVNVEIPHDVCKSFANALNGIPNLKFNDSIVFTLNKREEEETVMNYPDPNSIQSEKEEKKYHFKGMPVYFFHYPDSGYSIGYYYEPDLKQLRWAFACCHEKDNFSKKIARKVIICKFHMRQILSAYWEHDNASWWEICDYIHDSTANWIAKTPDFRLSFLGMNNRVLNCFKTHLDYMF